MYVFLFRFIRLSRKNVQTGQYKTFFRRTFRVFIVFFSVLRSFSFFSAPEPPDKAVCDFYGSKEKPDAKVG